MRDDEIDRELRELLATPTAEQVKADMNRHFGILQRHHEALMVEFRRHYGRWRDSAMAIASGQFDADDAQHRAAAAAYSKKIVVPTSAALNAEILRAMDGAAPSPARPTPEFRGLRALVERHLDGAMRVACDQNMPVYPMGERRYVGVDHGTDERQTEVEVRIHADGAIEVLDVREIPLERDQAVDKFE